MPALAACLRHRFACVFGLVQGVMVDVWWGLVEVQGPCQYHWAPYQALLQLVKKSGLLLQVSTALGITVIGRNERTGPGSQDSDGFKARSSVGYRESQGGGKLRMSYSPRSHDSGATLSPSTLSGGDGQVVMSFHACGNNVGDNTYVPLPPWVRQCAEQDPAIFFQDRAGVANPECVSLFSDDTPCLAGRTPLQVSEASRSMWMLGEVCSSFCNRPRAMLKLVSVPMSPMVT